MKFRIAAKTDVGLVRTNNEDNFQASADLTNGQMRWVNNEICSLGGKGALVVVADGMGGMNAGEVASELAIEAIREWFSPEKLTSEVMKTRFSIEKYMNDAIIAADSRIKAESKVRPETKGMGTTIVIGWILDGVLYVSWCGDSRAYVYNPEAGLHQITKDHSYVQGLVDRGAITREEAFDFPDSNIITRCLSDGTTKAKPQSLLKPYTVCDNDIIMLCTDGLSGMIRDQEIESLMRANEHNMDTLADELISAACAAEGSDNITICLCQILQCGNNCNPAVFEDYDRRLNGNNNFIRTLINKPDEVASKNRKFWFFGLAGIALVLICGATWWLGFRNTPESKVQHVQKKDYNEYPNPKTDTDTTKIGGGSDTVYVQTGGSSTSSEQRKNGGQMEVSKKAGQTGSVPKENADDEEDGEEDDQKPAKVDKLTPIKDPDNKLQNDSEENGQVTVVSIPLKKGDTYQGLAKNFETTVDALKKMNDNKELKVNDIINVPKQ